jgi:hypothetical protein
VILVLGRRLQGRVAAAWRTMFGDLVVGTLSGSAAS